MTFLTPWAFLGLAAAAPIIALYFLKLKRERIVVPSTWLWMRSLQDLTVNAPFQRLRKSLLLIVQVLLVTLAVVALARPSGASILQTGKGTVVLIDCSASMSAKDVPPSRLDKAKAEAKRVVGAMREGEQAMVIAFSNRAEVVQPFTTDRRAAERAIDSIRQQLSRTRVGEAFQMAVSAVRGPIFKEKEIVILSDGQFEPITAPTEGVPVTYVAIGGTIRNVAITALDVRRPSNPAEPWLVFAQLDLYSSKPVEVPVELYVDGKLAGVKNVALEPNSAQARIFELKEPPNTVEVRVAAEDDLAVDDRAWAVVSHRETKVLLVTAGNFFLEKAVLQLPDAQVDKVAPTDVKTDAFLEYDVVVLDGSLPPSPLPDGRYLILGAVPGWEGIETQGAIEQPEIIDWDRRHRVTRLINFSGLTIKTAPKLKLPAGSSAVLAEAQEAPMIFAWQRQRTKAVVAAFKLFDTNWPLRPSFPLMVINCVEWLRSDELAEWRGHPAPGEPLRLRLDRSETSLQVRGPDGSIEKISGRAGDEASTTRSDLPGIYSVRHADGREELVAVNLMDPTESSGRVLAELKLGEETITAKADAAPLRHDSWKIFAWIALGLLLAEWWIYHRRIEIF